MALMPEASSAASASDTALAPVVHINGIARPWMTCTAIEAGVGATPGKAMLQIHSDFSVAGPITLNAIDWTTAFKKGARVKVTMGEQTMHLGSLLPRQDQGQRDAIVWSSLDDRWILSRLPVRGALVYDGGSIKFFSRLTPWCNPQGAWNCMGVSYAGRTWPVFAPRAEQKKGWESTEDTFTEALVAGELTAWTPRRALQYLNLLMTHERDGWNYLTHYRNLERSQRIEWPVTAADEISGIIPGESRDPLDRKLQSVSLRGNCLTAISRALTLAGTHDLQLQPTEGDKSRVVFVNTVDCPDDAMEIPIFRGGTPTDTNTAFDFQLHETAEDVAESVLIEGEAVKVEASFLYEPSGSDNTIKPSASSTREEYFKHTVWGAAEGSAKGTYAQIPAAPEEAPSLDADGTSGKPYALACSKEALALARQLYPDVFTEFVVDSAKAYSEGILEGIASEYVAGSGKFKDTFAYPYYSGSRMTLPKQLQHMQLGEDYVKLPYPVRVQIYHDDKWIDVPAENGFRPGVASFRIGLAENVDGKPFCVYSGSMLIDPWGCEWKKVRVNLAVVMDHVTQGYAEISDPSELDPALEAEFNGPLMHYMPDGGFVENYQYKSKPSAMIEFENTGQTQDSDGITGWMPPGSDQAGIDAAAARQLEKRRYQTRKTSWKMVGVRADYQPGMWVSKVKVRGGVAGDIDYDLKAPIKTIVYDFLKQETHIGGLLSTGAEQGGGEPSFLPAKDPAAGVDETIRQAQDVAAKALSAVTSVF